jgi:hypothetical protein
MKDERPALAQWYIQQGKMADPKASYKLDNAIQFVAECQDMCPEYERHEREYTNFLEPFEKVERIDQIPGTDRVDHLKAVKRYKRSAAGDPPPLPCDVRPPPILFKTLDYLFHDIINQYGLQESHGFVRDRARAIRNDLTLQNYRGVEAVILHERIARYHIMCSNVLCGVEGFVMQQEIEQLRKTLLSLIEFYSEMQKKGANMPNEAEFQAYYILTFPWNNDVVSRLESELSPKVFFDTKVQLALEVRSLMTRRHDKKRPSVDGSLNHYSKIFEIIRRNTTPYLFACCVHMHFADIRRGGIRAMQRSYTFQADNPQSGIELQDIVDSLGFDGDEDCIQFLNHYFIDVRMVHDKKIAYVGRKVQDRNGKKERIYPKYPYSVIPDNLPSLKSNLVEKKREGISYLDVLDGKFNHVVQKPPNITLPGFVSPVKAHAEPRISTSLRKSPLFKTSPFSTSKFSPKVSPIQKKPNSLISKSSATQQADPSPSKFSFLQVPTPAPVLGSVLTSEFTIPKADSAPPNFFTSTATTQITNVFQVPPINPVASIQSSVSVVPSIPKAPVIPVTSIPPESSVRQSSPISKNPSTVSFSNPFLKETMTNTVILSKKYAEQEHVVDKLMEEVLKPFLIPIIQETMNELRLERLIEGIYEDLLVDCVRGVVEDRMVATRRLSNFREALGVMSETLIDEAITAIFAEVVDEALQSHMRIQNLQEFVICRWKFFVWHRRYLKERKQLLGQRMISFLRQAALVPTLMIPETPVKLAVNDSAIQTKLSTLTSEMSQRRAQWYTKINLQGDVIPYVESRIPSLVKILLYDQNLEHLPGTIPWFTQSWFLAKLSDSKSEKYLTDSYCVTNDYEKCRIIVQKCLSNDVVEKQHNSSSPYSGLNGMLYVAPYFSPEMAKRSYWEMTRSGLLSMESQIPAFARLPLLIVYWPSTELDVSEFESILAKQVNEIFGASITTATFLPLYISLECFDSVTATQSLVEKLIWLLDNAAVAPNLSTNIFHGSIRLI